MAKVCEKKYVLPDLTTSRSATADTAGIVFDFSNGTKRTVRFGDFPEAIHACALWHGLGAKLGDTYASSKGDPAAAVVMFDDTFDELKNGHWLAEGEAAGPRISDVAEALFILKPEKYATIEAAAAALLAMSPEERKVRAKHEAVVAKVLQIRAERAAKNFAGKEVSLDAL